MPDTFAKVSTSLSDEMLVLASLTGHEALGRPFKYELDLYSLDETIPLQDLLGESVTAQLEVKEGEYRYINGIVTRFACIGYSGRHARYRATLRPWLWLLTRHMDCRIFQGMTVPEVIKQVFRLHDFSQFDEMLTRPYREWEYICQYRESSFHFVSRLMEQEGIYYYFKHEAGQHTLFMTDSYSGHQPQPGYEEIPFYPPEPTERRERDHIDGWRVTQEIQPGKFALNDFEFKKPKAGLISVLNAPENKGQFEVYDYPGEYEIVSDGEQYTRVRMEQAASEYEIAEGLHGEQPKRAGEALLHPSEVVRRAALRGIALADPARLSAWALDRFRERPSPEIQASLLPLVAARLEQGALLACLKSEHPTLLCAAVDAVARGPQGNHLTRIEELLQHEASDVRRSALLAGLAWGSSVAWSELGKDALSGDPARAPRIALYAALSGPKQHSRLLELWTRDELRGHVLFALGFSGNPALLPALLEHLDGADTRHAKLAAQSIYLITGLDTQDDAYCLPPPAAHTSRQLPPSEDDPEALETLPAFEDDDLEADLVPIPEDALAEPNAAAMRAFWQSASSAFPEGQRYVLGQPLTVTNLLSALGRARMRVRHVLAQALAARTAGQCWLDTRDLVSRQRRKLSELEALQLRSFARQFGLL
ncbi:MAG TPA: type VI secretion system tip protein TssI/VgrG [Polyangiales bacterium]|nr:type VI secretion system tip protein TssI/VgrG [Polyangiales bacterium]